MESPLEVIEGVKPYDKRIYLLYRCRCGGEFEHTVAEATIVGKQLCPYCHCLLVFAPIFEVRALVRYSVNKSERIEGKSQKILLDRPPVSCYSRGIKSQDDALLQETVTSLEKLGYKRPKAIDITQSYLNQGGFTSTEQILLSLFSKSIPK